MQEFARVCQSMPEYARVRQSMPEYARVRQSMPEYARVCQSMSEYARVCQSMPEYGRVCQSTPEYARVCQSMPEYARVCQSMPEYARVINENWDRMAKIGFFGQKPKFWAQKKAVTFGDSPCSGHDRKKLFKEKKGLCPNNQGGKCHFGRFFGVRPIFRPKTTFRPNVKTPVSP